MTTKPLPVFEIKGEKHVVLTEEEYKTLLEIAMAAKIVGVPRLSEIGLKDLLIAHRVKKNLSQRKLAKAIGSSHASISLYERNKLPNGPQEDTFEKLANYFGPEFREGLEHLNLLPKVVDQKKQPTL